MISLTRSLAFRFCVKHEKILNASRCVLSPLETNCFFHTGQCFFEEANEKKPDTALVYVFDNVKEKQKEAFLDILRSYKRDKHTQSDVRFIQIALKYMEQYGVQEDLETYKAILNIFAKGPYIPRSYFQSLMQFFPYHQTVAVNVLLKMEQNRVIPDRETEIILLNIFGRHARPLKKLWRMLYWMPKFANINPWPVPRPIPTDPKVLARIAIHKISSIDVSMIISEFETTEVEKDVEYVEDTWIVSAMSPIQKDLLQRHLRLRKNESIYVEGPFKVWVANQSVDYFVLRGNPTNWAREPEDVDDVSNIKIPFWKTREVGVQRTVHDQDDGTYFALCATGTSSKDSVVSWIRHLQKEIPFLEEIPILIKLSSMVEPECTKFLERENERLEGKETD